MTTVNETEGRTRRVASLLRLTKVLLRHELTLLKRYPVNTASMFLTLVSFFAVIFFGGRAVAGPALTQSLEGIIVGLFLFTLSTSAYSGLARNVASEAEWGTLERLFISPHGFGTVMAVKSVVNVLLSFLWGFSVLLVTMAISRRWLQIDPLTVVPLVTLTLLSVLGIGFFFAGVALVYKRIENVFQLVQFGFVGLIAAPVEAVPLLGVLPVALGSTMTQQAMAEGVRLWEFEPAALGTLVLVNVAYLLAGYYCFQVATRKARSESLLGHY